MLNKISWLVFQEMKEIRWRLKKQVKRGGEYEKTSERVSEKNVGKAYKL